MKADKDKTNWTLDLAENTWTPTKSFLAKLSVSVRRDQMSWLIKKLQPKPQTTILDAGFANDANSPSIDTNFFTKEYPHKTSITAASVENCDSIKEKYKGVNIVKINPKSKLPFKDGEFDIATSWATLEHVGNYKDQELFINELLRVGKKMFLTVPYRACIYEPHAGFFFLHWLPLNLFRKLCIKFNKAEWAEVDNLNPLYIRDIKKFNLDRKIHIKVYKIFGFLPSHLILTSVD